MSHLDPSEFASFFEAVYGYEPFPWQKRLAARVFSDGWDRNRALDVPTGAGKTATIDIAVFHLALEAERGHERRAAMRIAFVVDRRLVVDDAYNRADKLAKALDDAKDGVVARVAGRLRALSGGAPLDTAKLRGGAPRDPDWARSPCQPLVIVSTVDQVGSRVLFRGYGVSDSMKPVHAGLLGADVLYLLDEAHLSKPFVDTLTDTHAIGEPGWRSLREPFSIVTLSATQTSSAVEPLVGDDDRAHALLGPRLQRPKPTALEGFKGSSKDPEYRATLVDRAWRSSILGGGTAEVVAVVVNRVRRAREVFDALRRQIAERAPAFEGAKTAALLIGRTRPLDAARVLDEFKDRISATVLAPGEQRPPRAPLFIVATQCVEAGADLDFDALITEVAPLDCLRQRFGRLNRMGALASAPGVIVAAADDIGKAKDPIYGEALAKTWDLLTERATKVGKDKALEIDLGIAAAEAWLPPRDERAPHLAPARAAPVLLPAFLEQWSCTSPIPAVDPDVALFLHGTDVGPGDVEIVWRADVEPSELHAIYKGDGAPQDDLPALLARLDVCPPSSLESLSVPLIEARSWLAHDARGDIADVEVTPRDDGDVREHRRVPRFALRWRGVDHPRTGIVRASDLRPGDVVVVPASYGGVDRWGWRPDSDELVRDLGSEANRAQRGLDVLRLTQPFLVAEWSLEIASSSERERQLPDLRRRAREVVRDLDEARNERVGALIERIGRLRNMPPSFRDWLERKGKRRQVFRDPRGRPFAIVRRTKQDGLDATTESGLSTTSDRRLSLAEHSKDVECVAKRFSEACGLSARMVDDLKTAGFVHDAGKAHPDFKLWMYAGDELEATGPDLAKSGRRKLPPSGRLPQGARHEVASLAFAAAHPRCVSANDLDLVLWLIGTHHGFGRPFFPAVDWPPKEPFTADLGKGKEPTVSAPPLDELTASWLDRYDRLYRRRGPWGLARLEAILRLADHRASREADERHAAAEQVADEAEDVDDDPE